MKCARLYSQDLKQQMGFSLVEVLISMLIAAVAVGGVMLIHANNLKQISSTAELSRAQLLLNNMAQRMQINDAGLQSGAYAGTWTAAMVAPTACPSAGCSASQWAMDQDVPAWRSEAFDTHLSGLPVANLSISAKNKGWLLQIDWQAHDAAEAVVRSNCQHVATGRHCVALWIAS